jgi:hypothetical protein
MVSPLITLDVAGKTLADLTARLRDADSIPELRTAAQAAAAFRDVLQRAKFSQTWQNRFAALRLRGMRRIGEMLAQIERHRGGRPTDKPVIGDDRFFTLAELGIARNFSSECQAIARIPIEDFEIYLVAGSSDETEITKAGCLALIKGPNDSDESKLHYWATPPDMKAKLTAEFGQLFDPCPHPRPEGFDGLVIDWEDPSYINAPFDDLMPWVRKALEQRDKGKTCLLTIPIYKNGIIAMLDDAGAEIRYIGVPDWLALEDGSTNPLPATKRQPCVLAILRPMSTNQVLDRCKALVAEIVENIGRLSDQHRREIEAEIYFSIEAELRS